MRNDPHVDGSATVYRQYDVGYALSLDHAANLLGDITRGRVRPARVEARAIERPGVAPVSEEYIVFRVDRLAATDSELAATQLLNDQQLVSLLLGERRALSPSARRELMPHRFSYYDDADEHSPSSI
jgi:hypothetical protein